MKKYLRKTLAVSALVVVALAIIALLFQGKYIHAIILFASTWAVLFTIGAYWVPFYVKRLILKYLDSKGWEAGISEIKRYCSSKNESYHEEAVEIWLRELQMTKKIKLQGGKVLKLN